MQNRYIIYYYMYQRSNYQYQLDHRKSKRIPEKHLLCFTDYAKVFDCVDHNKLWEILQEMGIPDHLTCLLRPAHPRACVLQREKPPPRETGALQLQSSPRLPQLEKSSRAAAKTQQGKNTLKKEKQISRTNLP